MEDAMRIMEEILETEYKGLVYINETREIGSYSRCAKKITGILLDSEQRHPGGRIEEGDIVIIADNELGNDDESTPESLETIGIADRNIEKATRSSQLAFIRTKKYSRSINISRATIPMDGLSLLPIIWDLKS